MPCKDLKDWIMNNMMKKNCFLKLHLHWLLSNLRKKPDTISKVLLMGAEEVAT